jgi:hypothetical protein
MKVTRYYCDVCGRDIIASAAEDVKGIICELNSTTASMRASFSHTLALYVRTRLQQPCVNECRSTKKRK